MLSIPLALQSFSAYCTISGIVNAGHQLNKVCSSDVMHCQISIFEIKLMLKIGVIIMPFSNPTCHLKDMS